MRSFGILALAFFTLLGCHSEPLKNPKTQIPPVRATEASFRPDAEAAGSQFAISTQGIATTMAARKILDAGGNLIDAAIAASFTISVERPQSTGLGGGGFLMYREAKSGKIYAIDFRERAPLKATPNMYLKKDGTPDPKLSRTGGTSVAVPGLVAGLAEIHKRFGTKPWAELVQPAIDLAEKGFTVYPVLAEALQHKAELLAQQPAARAIFLDSKGQPWPLGHVIVQKDLGQTLRKIAREGRDGFYKGSVARSLVQTVQTHHGLLSAEDLNRYHVKWHDPVHGNFHGYEIYSMPPPSSGGTHVIQFLQFLDQDPLKQWGPMSAASLHLEASALQSSFADRARYMGDPDFVKVPLAQLLDPAYAKRRRAEVNMDHARTADQVSAGPQLGPESHDTTHFSIIDADGNAIASTQTVNGYLGSALVADGTGVILNNEMDDFSAKAGTANMFGAIGGVPNSIAPEKTPLSSMSPTIVLKDGQLRMAVGAPGGTRIISCVAQTILNVLEYQMPLESAVSTIRYHQQWKPDVLQIEPPGPGTDVIDRLKKLGYEVQMDQIGCHVMAAAREGQVLRAVSDPRDIGTASAK